jgi:hypothetical protein
MIRSVIRQMMALALVPEEYVPQLFANLGQELTESDRLDLSNLFKYFDNQWMRNLAIWNVFNVSDRTNNYSEGIEYLRIFSRDANIRMLQDTTTASINDYKRTIQISGYSSMQYAKKLIRSSILLVKYIPACSRIQNEK